MATAFVQKLAQATSSTNAVNSATLPANVTAGNFIVVAVQTLSTSVSVSSIHDTLGNTYTQAGSGGSSPGIGNIVLWYAKNVVGGSCTVTVTLTAVTSWDFTIIEYSGVKLTSPLDGSHSSSGISTTVTTGTIPVAGSSDLVIGMLATSAIGSNAAASPFTGIASFGTASLKCQIVNHHGASAGEAASATISVSTSWLGFGVSFLSASPPPPPPPPVNVYVTRFYGPPIPGSPWPVIMPPRIIQAIPPPSPLPPSPPIPVPPPPPPNVPPPPIPPPPVPLNGFPQIDRVPVQESRMRRFTAEVSSVLNSLFRTGQLVDAGHGNYYLVPPSYGGSDGVHTAAGQFVYRIDTLHGQTQGVFSRAIGDNDLPIVTTLTPGTYTNPRVTLDQYGRVMSASNASGRIMTFLASVSNTTTGAEDTLMTGTVPANTLTHPGDTLEFLFAGTSLNGGGGGPDSNKYIRLYYGGVKVADTGLMASNNIGGNRWNLHVHGVMVTTGTMRFTASMTFDENAGLTYEALASYTAISVDSTTALTVLLTGEADGGDAAAGDVTATLGFVNSQLV